MYVKKNYTTKYLYVMIIFYSFNNSLVLFTVKIVLKETQKFISINSFKII